MEENLSIFRNTSITKGYQVYFLSMGELIQLLKTEEFTHKSQIQMKCLHTSYLVVIDNIMYMALDEGEATLFFQLIHQRYVIKASTGNL